MSRRKRTSKRSQNTTRQLSRSKKFVFAGVTVVAVFCTLELVLWLCRVEPAHVREDPYAGFSRNIPHFVTTAGSSGELLLTVSPNKARVLNPQQFTADKPDDVYRIVCLGGSTTYGRPFFDHTSFPGWLREFLTAAQPSRRWEVINAGGISYASYRAQGLMEELAEYSPDLFIVYTGQNEFLERRTYEGFSGGASWQTGPLSLVSRTRTATVIRAIMDLAGIRRRQVSHQASKLGDEVTAIPINAIGPEAYSRNEELHNQVVEHFRSTLNRMVQIAEQEKADILFIVPASNLADFAPFRSQHRAGLSNTDLTEWNRYEEHARTLMSQGKAAEALVKIRQAEVIDSHYAALWFLKGQAEWSLGEFDRAKQSFRKARDEDVCPLRAVERILQVVRDIPGSNGKSVVDFEQIVTQHSEHGIPGKSMFHDHVHPTIEANRLLALEIVNEMRDRKILQPAPTWGEESIAVITKQVESRVDRQLHARQLRLLAAMLAWLDQPVAARSQAELSLELSGRTEEALLDLAGGLQNQRAFELAFEYLQAAIQLNPASARAHLASGSCAMQAGDEAESIRQLQQAVALAPDLTDAHVQLAIALATQGQLPQAEHHLTVALRLAPESAVIHNNLGLVMAKKGQLSKALESYSKSLALNANESSTHYNVGLTLEQLGQLDQAKTHYLEAIRLAKGHAGALARLNALQNPALAGN